MNIKQAKEIVISVIIDALEKAEIEDEILVTEKMQLIGASLFWIQWVLLKSA